MFFLICGLKKNCLLLSRTRNYFFFDGGTEFEERSNFLLAGLTVEPVEEGSGEESSVS